MIDLFVLFGFEFSVVAHPSMVSDFLFLFFSRRVNIKSDHHGFTNEKTE
jgi:hypothetical protein